jgi:hypothetical protein
MHELYGLIWLLPTGVAGFGVKFLRDMSRSMAALNTTMAIVVTRIDTHEEKLTDHEGRIRHVEHGSESR